MTVCSAYDQRVSASNWRDTVSGPSPPECDFGSHADVRTNVRKGWKADILETSGIDGIGPHLSFRLRGAVEDLGGPSKGHQCPAPPNADSEALEVCFSPVRHAEAGRIRLGVPVDINYGTSSRLGLFTGDKLPQLITVTYAN